MPAYKRFLTLSVFLCSFIFPLVAQDSLTEATDLPDETPATENRVVEESSELAGGLALQMVLSRLYSGKVADEEELNRLLEAAKKADASEQQIMEGRIIFHLVRRNYTDLSILIPQISDLIMRWEYDDSQLFENSKQLASFVYALTAYSALEAGDDEAFERAAKESFWQEPEFASMIGVNAWVETFHNQKALVDVKVPMDIAIPVSAGGTTTLADLAVDQKALLVDFWASWCGPCMNLMGELKERAGLLVPQGVIVVGMNTESREEAEKIRKEQGMEFPWLVEPENQVYSQLLRIDSIPRVLLLAPDGSILFTGHPLDPKLNSTLAKMGVTLNQE